MTNLTITVEDNQSAEYIRPVLGKILDYNNNNQKQEDVAYPLVILIRDTNSEIVGGLVRETYWGWLFISHLWVAQSLRCQGYGR